MCVFSHGVWVCLGVIRWLLRFMVFVHATFVWACMLVWLSILLFRFGMCLFCAFIGAVVYGFYYGFIVAFIMCLFCN